MLQALSRWKTSILVLSALLVLGLFVSRHLVGPFSGGGAVVGPISPEEAADYIGKRAEVCGSVAEVVQVQDIEGNPTFINLGAEHPNQDFTALIWADDRDRWDTTPEVLYDGQSICISGTVERHEGTPQIIVSSPTQIQLR